MKERFVLVILCMIFSYTVMAQHQPLLTKLKPDYVATQYAGSIGMMSVGAGYSFAHNHLLSSVHYGHVPQSVGGQLDILTLKFTYVPWAFEVKKNDWYVLPFNPVMFGSYTINRDFHIWWPPDEYVKGYYWWSPAIRWHLGFTSEIFIRQNTGKYIDGMSLYAEASANNLYLESKRINPDALSLWDITTIGVGVKWKLK